MTDSEKAERKPCDPLTSSGRRDNGARRGRANRSVDQKATRKTDSFSPTKAPGRSNAITTFDDWEKRSSLNIAREIQQICLATKFVCTAILHHSREPLSPMSLLRANCAKIGISRILLRLNSYTLSRAYTYTKPDSCPVQISSPSRTLRPLLNTPHPTMQTQVAWLLLFFPLWTLRLNPPPPPHPPTHQPLPTHLLSQALFNSFVLQHKVKNFPLLN